MKIKSFAGLLSLPFCCGFMVLVTVGGNMSKLMNDLVTDEFLKTADDYEDELTSQELKRCLNYVLSSVDVYACNNAFVVSTEFKKDCSSCSCSPKCCFWPGEGNSYRAVGG